MEKNRKKTQSFLLTDRKQNETTCYLSRYEAYNIEEIFLEKKCLSESEGKYYETLTATKRKISYLLGRSCAKEALTKALGAEASQVEIANGIFGQPVLKNMDWEVSITHTDHEGACLLYPRQIVLGIDIEEIIEERIEVMKSITEEEECQQMLQFISQESIALTAIWTLKEALGKALRVGLTVPSEFMQVKLVKYLPEQMCLESSFINFPQYQARSWIHEKSVMSIVYPANTQWKDCK